MKARQSLALLFGLTAALLPISQLQIRADSTRSILFQTHTMGAWASLTVVTADSAAVADVAYEALAVFHRVDSLMSNWTEVSEIARVNREAGRGVVTVHPEVARVLDFALRVDGESDGAFDVTVEPLVRLWGFLGGAPRVPSQEEIAAALERTGRDKLQWNGEARALRFTRGDVRVDLGGIAKGYGVDCVADLLRDAGVSDALVDLSGNMVALGNTAGRDGWTVGIRDPGGERPYVARLRLFDEAVATSGNYEQFVDADGKRYGHILDPRTGSSARGLTSVTIVTDRAMTADAWATALFVLGSDEARNVARQRDDFAAILIEPVTGGPDVIWVEQELRARFALADGTAATYTVRYF